MSEKTRTGGGHGTGGSVMGGAAGVVVVGRLGWRLARFRSGWWWVLPVVGLGCVLGLAFMLLARLDPVPENDRVYRFGQGNTVSVSFNAWLDANAAEFHPEQAMAELGQFASGSPCWAITASVSLGLREWGGYREFMAGCDPQQWGYRLRSGRWPTQPGEAAATAAMGLGVGEQLTNGVPRPVSVVGIVENVNAIQARMVLAAPGTWRSWGWPAIKARYPTLSAIVMGYANVSDIAALKAYYIRQENEAARAAGERVESPDTDTGKSRHAIDSIDAPQTSFVDKLEFVYRDVAVVVAGIATALGLAFRWRYIRSRRALLVEQGMTPRRAAVTLSVSAGLVLAGAVVGAVLVAWGLGFLLEPAVWWITGHAPSSNPAPVDPLWRIGLGVLTVWAVQTGAGLWRTRTPPTGDPAAFRAVAAPARLRLFRTRLVLAGALTVGALYPLVMPDRDDTIFQYGYPAIMALVLAFGCASPELCRWVLGNVQPAHSAVRLATRRLRAHPVLLALTVTGAALTIAPVLAGMTLHATSLATNNAHERHPPSAGQVLFNMQGSRGSLRNEVGHIVHEAGGPDVTEVTLATAESTDHRSISATARGVGPVFVAQSVADLETVFGATLPDEARHVLDTGGVLWTEFHPDTAPLLWLDPVGKPGTKSASSTGSTAESVTLTGQVHAHIDERWARHADGYILASTAAQHDLRLTDDLVVFGGISAAESARIPDRLTEAHLSTYLVTRYRESDPFTDRPVDFAQLGLLGLVGIVMLLTTVRSSIRGLRRQSPSLILLGVPRGWLGRVFLHETLTTLALGAALGIILGTAYTTAGLLSLTRVVLTIPWTPVTLYLVALILILGITTLTGLHRIRT